MEEVKNFIKECGAYFLATVDGDQPRVRPFGTVNIFEGKLYIQTGTFKNVSKHTVGEGMPYRNQLPIVYYGSSITQGGCASRPGNAYQNIISRHLNMDFLNLGFSGNAKAEDAVTNYMADLPMLVFVCDYDHNAPNVEYLRSTHQKLYDTIRKKNPDVPFIMLSRPDFECNLTDNRLRRDVIMETLLHARANGDKNIWFVDGSSLFRGQFGDACTVDGTHPTDLGFGLFAEKLEDELRHVLIHPGFDY